MPCENYDEFALRSQYSIKYTISGIDEHHLCTKLQVVLIKKKISESLAIAIFLMWDGFEKIVHILMVSERGISS